MVDSLKKLCLSGGMECGYSAEPGVYEQAYVLATHSSRQMLQKCFTSRNIHLVRAAAKEFGLRGSYGDTESLVCLLRHPDKQVVLLAENSLWSIWMRAGDSYSNALLADSVQAIARGCYPEAVRRLCMAIRRTPDFAEAHNQLAIAHCLMARYLDGIRECARTLEINPWHFAAAANLGHCHIVLGNYEQAGNAYLRALKIHPRLEGVRRQIRQIENVRHFRPCDPAA